MYVYFKRALTVHIMQTLNLQLKMEINRGQDLSSAEVRVEIESAPLSFVGAAFTRKHHFSMGARNSFTWDEVIQL